MKIVKKILLFLLVIFVVAQFFGPEKNEGEFSSLDAFIAETNPPANVKGIMKETCLIVIVIQRIILGILM